MNRAWLANIGSGYFISPELALSFVGRVLDCCRSSRLSAETSGRYFHELIFILREPFQTPGFLEVPI
ncbi:hypothetical protein SAMN05216412_107177 [Nitrosospira multiformis]|uniref:Uncharacterized protein n=1 Tax=Nitrosospira multiformis TaxID=1231 RepID=A0A1I0F0Q9_9PROT|nr:hypothetical protein SAMN05216412_107177 [Nitrosospira multiformis]